MEYAHAKIVISFGSKASCRISSDFDVVYAEILPCQNRLSLLLFILEPCGFLGGYAGSCAVLLASEAGLPYIHFALLPWKNHATVVARLVL